jgi:hypothetical protein
MNQRTKCARQKWRSGGLRQKNSFLNKSIMASSPCNEPAIRQNHAIHDLVILCIAILDFLRINLGFCTRARFQRVNT